MKRKLKLKDGHNVFHVLYVLGFLFAMSLALPIYINSSFLKTFVPEQFVGMLYTASSILTFFGLAFMPLILSKFGNYKTTLIGSMLVTVLLFVLAFTDSALVAIPAFIVYASILTLIYFNFDVFLESYSSDKTTGSTRGSFLTILNIAILISPLIAGALLTNGDYWKIYLLAAGLMTMLIALLPGHFSKFKDPKYERVPFWKTLRMVLKNVDLRNIFVANMFLRFFFAWMVIYSPIYLHQHIGFEWSTLGIIFTLMLLPFVLFELPAGRLADSRYGEKEIMTLGFIIMGLATMSIIFINEPIFWVWVFVLFVSRIGASLVEITTESYFFKHVDGNDANIIGFFRNNRPIAYTTAPILASIVLLFVPFKFLFLILGFIMLFGVRFALAIKDTK